MRNTMSTVTPTGLARSRAARRAIPSVEPMERRALLASVPADLQAWLAVQNEALQFEQETANNLSSTDAPTFESGLDQIYEQADQDSQGPDVAYFSDLAAGFWEQIGENEIDIDYTLEGVNDGYQQFIQPGIDVAAQQLASETQTIQQYYASLPGNLTATLETGNDSLDATAGQPLSGAIAVINVDNPDLGASGLTGQIINQTDGTTTPADIVPAGQDTWDVYDTESFQDPGPNDVTVDVSDQQGDTIQLQGQVSVTAPPPTANSPGTSSQLPPATNTPSTASLVPEPFPNVGPPARIVLRGGVQFNRSMVEEAERLANGVVDQINSSIRAGAAVVDFAKLPPSAKAQLIGSAIDNYATELKNSLDEAQRDPAGAAARWLGSVVRDTVKTLSDSNAAETAGRQVVRRLLSNATGSLGASKPSRGVGHIIKPVAGAGTAALEGGLEKAAIRYFASQGEKILRSKIGGSDRGIDIASYVGQGTRARLIISESKNLGGIVRGASLTALGSGKQGVDRVNLKRLESNLAVIRRSIENGVQDPTTRQTLLTQLDPNSQTGPILRLVGNTAKGTSFDESAIQEIMQDVSSVVKFQWPPVILNLTVSK
jgi:hypothetical protein